MGDLRLSITMPCAPLEEAALFANASIDVLSCFARHAGMTEFLAM
jgi:hypothetical protein